MEGIECLAVDWSGARTGEAARIWIGRAVDGELTALTAPGSRAAVGEVLRARRADPRPCLAGLDFGFSVPAWYAGARGWRSAAEVWAAAGDDGERWLAECAPPFWGRPGHPRPHDVDAGLRQTERAWSVLQRPKSVFQVGGAGSVGTGSIRGMPMLLSLRQAGWAVWPFDARGDHTLVEIYPRLFTGRVIKRSAEARGEFLTAHCRQVPAGFQRSMLASEDAFDAGVSAIGMSCAVGRAEPWRIQSALAEIEGQIWAPDGAAPSPR